MADRKAGGIVLTDDQSAVFSKLKVSLGGEGQRHFLLYGVTGSGKTEIYLRIINDALKQGLGAILLVPEISLTPQTVNYFSRRIGDGLAILHSRLTKAEKIAEWFRILAGEKRIVIGARSAVFAPMERIGVVIVDEEHETSYKSDETPRYSAKSVAMYRANRHAATLILGSATPSLESFFLAKTGKLSLLRLPSRVMNLKLPDTHIAGPAEGEGGEVHLQPSLSRRSHAA